MFIVLFVGLKKSGKAFKQAWRRSSRKLKSRLAMGLLKANKESKIAYVDSVLEL